MPSSLLFHRFDAEATEWFDEDTFTDYETLIADWGMKEYGLTYPKYSHFDSQAVDRFEAGARFLGSGKIAVLNRLHGESTRQTDIPVRDTCFNSVAARVYDRVSGDVSSRVMYPETL